MKKWPGAAARMALLSVIFFWTPPVNAEFFKFVDKDGVTRYVDDLGKIPPEYREATQVYPERYDHLPERERAVRLEQEREEEERSNREQMTREQENTPMEEERRRDPPASRPEIPAETKITIKGNHVLVPVVLTYGGHEVQATLLLDTGATIVSLHQQIADQLKIVPFKTVTAQVADGQTVPFRLAELDSISVGPHKMEKIMVGIYDQAGWAVSYDGLLGMNFLKNLEYTIDFNKKVIKWSSELQ